MMANHERFVDSSRPMLVWMWRRNTYPGSTSSMMMMTTTCQTLGIDEDKQRASSIGRTNLLKAAYEPIIATSEAQLLLFFSNYE